jgi:hypothetical protein
VRRGGCLLCTRLAEWENWNLDNRNMVNYFKLKEVEKFKDFFGDRNYLLVSAEEYRYKNWPSQTLDEWRNKNEPLQYL